MTDRAALLGRLAGVVAEVPDTGVLTYRLCEATRRILGADGASIAMDAGSTHRLTVCATDDDAARLESLHDVLGDGPSTAAYRSGRPVVLPVASPPPEWSVFAEAAARRTPAAVLFAVPMRQDATVLGVLSLYRSTAGDLAEPLIHAEYLADALAAALLRDYVATSGLGEDPSWTARDQVHQATGMVVAQLGLGVRDALALLRAHAFALDQSLDDVARSVLRREIVFGRRDA